MLTLKTLEPLSEANILQIEVEGYSFLVDEISWATGEGDIYYDFVPYKKIPGSHPADTLSGEYIYQKGEESVYILGAKNVIVKELERNLFNFAGSEK